MISANVSTLRNYRCIGNQRGWLLDPAKGLDWGGRRCKWMPTVPHVVDFWGAPIRGMVGLTLF